jgi:AraC-like DNA-binding protein
MQKIKLFLFYLLIFSSFWAKAQQFTIVPDSLKKYSYLELADKVILNTTKDPLLDKKNYIYAYADLLKAKKENNNEEIFYGYLLMANATRDLSLAMKYSDSACNLAKTKIPKLLSRAYYDRGGLYYIKNELKNALNCFLIASRDTINPSKNIQNKINYSIGMIKNTQGDYKEALAIYKKCEVIARVNKLPSYLMYLLGLSELYNRNNNIVLSEQCVSKGIALRKKEVNGEMYYPYFIANQGKNEYKLKQYNKAITDLSSSIAIFQKSGDYANYAECSFFIGECYREQKQDEKAMHYYKKVDSVFTGKNDIYALNITAYEHLIAHYKKKQDYKQVIYYSDQFIKADKFLNDNYKYIASKIAKTYDIQKIVASKQALIASLNNDKKMSFITILVLLFITTVLAGLFYFKIKEKRKELAKQEALFNAYIKEREEKITTTIESIPLEAIENKKRTKTVIDENVIQQIASHLETYENEERFLKNHTLETLALVFNTNTRYLSFVINETKRCSFVQYVNKLRMEYIIEKLEKNNAYLKYSIQGLSDSAGYNSVDTFNRAFKEHTKMNPSEFIKQLKIRNLNI